MICLLLVAYMGESLMAIAAPCAMMMPASPGQASVPASNGGDSMPAGMEHHGHHMTMDVPAGVEIDPSVGSCCDIGLCDMSHCLTVAALLPDGYVGELALARAHRDTLLVFSPIDQPGFLFRPPISR